MQWPSLGQGKQRPPSSSCSSWPPSAASIRGLSSRSWKPTPSWKVSSHPPDQPPSQALQAGDFLQAVLLGKKDRVSHKLSATSPRIPRTRKTRMGWMAVWRLPGSTEKEKTDDLISFHRCVFHTRDLKCSFRKESKIKSIWGILGLDY